MHLRALGEFGFFKIVLITNTSGLNRSDSQRNERRSQ